MNKSLFMNLSTCRPEESFNGEKHLDMVDIMLAAKIIK